MRKCRAIHVENCCFESMQCQSGKCQSGKCQSNVVLIAILCLLVLTGRTTTMAASEPPTVAEVDLDHSPDAAQVLQTTATEADLQTPHPLSVEPSSQMLPKDRPSWIDSDPDMESETHRFVVASIPTSLRSELDSHLEATLVAALKSYVNQQFGTDADQLINDRLTVAFIQTNLVDDNKTYVAEMQTGEGPMFQKWVMVEVTPQQRHQLQLWVSQQVQQQRLLPLGLLLSGLLTLIGMSHLVLKRRSTIPDNLKVTQMVDQHRMHPISGQAPQPASKKATGCCGSKGRALGMIKGLFIAAIVIGLVLVPALSKGKKSHRIQRETRQQVEVEEVTADADCEPDDGRTIVL